MRQKSMAAARVFAEWRTDPAYLAAYDALDEEFSLPGSLIGERSEAALTQDQLAKRMGTTQAAIARLESGKSLPSTRTLQRFAAATGTRLRIAFAPIPSSSASKRRARAK